MYIGRGGFHEYTTNRRCSKQKLNLTDQSAERHASINKPFDNAAIHNLIVGIVTHIIAK